MEFGIILNTHRTLMYSTNYDDDRTGTYTVVQIGTYTVVQTETYDTVVQTIKPSMCNPNYVLVSWDYENTKIDKIMGNDYSFNPPEKTNFMWIKIIKEKYHWEKGQRLYIDMNRNCDGLFRVWGMKKREHKTHQIYINSKGFVVHLKADFNKYNKTKDYKDVEYKYKLADCMYNDLLKISN